MAVAAEAASRAATMSNDTVLRVTDAFRSFGATPALAGASFDLRPGELLALLGPNGAGKTTLIRAIAGRVKLDRGSIERLGEPLGIVPQELALYPLLTARENLEVFGSLHGVARADLKARVDWALEWTALADRHRQVVKGFSGGMKRRLNIACGVLHRPRVVLLDEPTVGVDPQSRERIYDMLATLRREGASLLLTTHQLDEAEARCDRVVIIDHGKVIATGAVPELVEKTLGRRRAAVFKLAAPPATTPAGFTAADDPSTLRAELSDLGVELPSLIAKLQATGARIDDVRLERRGLHEVFLHLTGKELRE